MTDLGRMSCPRCGMTWQTINDKGQRVGRYVVQFNEHVLDCQRAPTQQDRRDMKRAINRARFVEKTPEAIHRAVEDVLARCSP